MVIISLMILIIAIALTPNTSGPHGTVSQQGSAELSAGSFLKGSSTGGISPILITRLTSIVFLFSGALAYNALYIQSIGSGLSLYSGLFQVTSLSQSFDLFVFVLAFLILIPWSNNFTKNLNSVSQSGPENTGPTHLSLSALPSSSSSALRSEADALSAMGAGRVMNLIPYLTGPIVSEYSLILLFSTLGSSLLLSSGNLLSLYLSIELQSFGVYILATIYRNSESATNAGLKYFLLGGLSSCLILLGCVLIYSYTGLISFEDIYSLIVSCELSSISAQSAPVPEAMGASVAGAVDTALNVSYNDIGIVIQLGLILIFIGLLFKIAAAPFHNWAPDVYNDVPSIVTTWLTIMPKIAIIILGFEIISSINLDVLASLSSSISGLSAAGGTGTNLLKNLLLISAFLSLIIGTIVGLAQIKIKRLLAYSTISHVGFLLLALSINTEESLESLLFYLVQYSLTNLNTFFVILAFGYILKKSISNTYGGIFTKKGERSGPAFRPQSGWAGLSASREDINLIAELKGQFWLNPLLSLSLAISLFSMAGIPPLVGFFAKAQVLYSAVQNGYYFISFIAILVSVISAYYYLQIIRVMHFDAFSAQSSELSASAGAQKAGSSASPKVGTENIEGLNPNLQINNTHSFIISTLTLSLLLFILKPSIVLNSIHLIALNIFYS